MRISSRRPSQASTTRDFTTPMARSQSQQPIIPPFTSQASTTRDFTTPMARSQSQQPIIPPFTSKKPLAPAPTEEERGRSQQPKGKTPIYNRPPFETGESFRHQQQHATADEDYSPTDQILHPRGYTPSRASRGGYSNAPRGHSMPNRGRVIGPDNVLPSTEDPDDDTHQTNAAARDTRYRAQTPRPIMPKIGAPAAYPDKIGAPAACPDRIEAPACPDKIGAPAAYPDRIGAPARHDKIGAPAACPDR
uniref:Uncharacterized protein n=1 Tax=Ustilaginoidea virens TaxID=1159556 RepID=A0A1X9WE76_USTVR|nr:hypothetical protein [Ustilaginoidea virens]